MQEIKLIIKTIGIFILLFEVINVSYYYKQLFKLPQHEVIKPFDCVLCMVFWSGVIAFITPDNYLYEFSLIITSAFILDKLWNRI
jgi:hypothetical protein